MPLRTPYGLALRVRIAAWIVVACAGCSDAGGDASRSSTPDAHAPADRHDAGHAGTLDAGRGADSGRISSGTGGSGASTPFGAGGSDAAGPPRDASSPAAPDAALDASRDAGAHRGLRGAFLELSNDHPASLYRDAILEMAQLGMDTAIVQTESYLEQPDFTRNAVDRELLRAVLDQAESSGLRVHVGLALPEWGNGDETHARNSAFVDGAITAAKASLDTLLADFAGHAAWTGCYLSIELWTPASVDQLGELPRYVREVSGYVKQHGAFQVSMSPFVSAEASDDGATRAAFSALFSDADVDLVALQDGAGARDLAPAQLADNLPYYQAMIDACDSRCEVWANVEAFAADLQSATTWTRFLAQMQTLAPVVPNQITYEYTNDLMSNGTAAGAGALHSPYASWLRAP